MAEPVRQQPNFDAPLLQRPPDRAREPEGVPAAVPASTPQRRIFAADRAGADGLPAEPALSRLAELVAHRGADGPFTLALVGGPGSGKSRALAGLVAEAEALSRAAGQTSPFLPGLVTVRIDASELGEDVRAALARHVHAALSQTDPVLAAEAADEANHSSSDPHARLQSLNESLDTGRRRLDAERRARDDADGRRARLAEAILYESGSSRVDAYARANRGNIESALTSFGFTKGDPIATYKGLVQTLCDSGGQVSRIGASLKSLWAYRGQTKLIVWAVLLFIVSSGLATLANDPKWIDSVRNAATMMAPVADWLGAHRSWFGVASTVALIGAILCLLACIYRAVRFSRPLLRGASLVDADLGVRRGELENLVAHHAQRVEALTGEADTLARRVADAERRVGTARPAAPAWLVTDAASDADRARRSYVAQVGTRMARDPNGNRRVLVALDELDRLPPARALETLQHVAATLSNPVFGLVVAVDADRILAAHGGEARAALDRLVQVPYRVDGDTRMDWTDFVSRVAEPMSAAPRLRVNADQSTLDAPLHAAETEMLARLSPLAGPSPRQVKRYVNLYRLGRQDATQELAAFALTLALLVGGTDPETAAFTAALRDGDAQSPMPRSDVGRLGAALDVANAVGGRTITIEEARRARSLAARWSLTA